jgi:hypothetical protein
MSDLADKIFKELIAIQATRGGDIPPDEGIAVIRACLKESREKLVSEIQKIGALA